MKRESPGDIFAVREITTSQFEAGAISPAAFSGGALPLSGCTPRNLKLVRFLCPFVGFFNLLLAC